MLTTCLYVLTDIVSQKAISYFARHGEDRKAHHSTLGMDGNSLTCHISGYHTTAWWEVTFGKEYAVTGVEIYGKGCFWL